MLVVSAAALEALCEGFPVTLLFVAFGTDVLYELVQILVVVDFGTVRVLLLKLCARRAEPFFGILDVVGADDVIDVLTL